MDEQTRMILEMMQKRIDELEEKEKQDSAGITALSILFIILFLALCVTAYYCYQHEQILSDIGQAITDFKQSMNFF